ncbi:hypothetical protein Trydic_g13265 [Trypoxylus dichotomus]
MHSITFTNDIPIRAKTYRYPEIHKDEIKTQIGKMLDEGIIKPSTSPCSSSLCVIPKEIDASGKTMWRVIIDYRKPNNVAIGDAYPIPHITEILDQLSRIFYHFGFGFGVHQVGMNAKDAEKTTFTTPFVLKNVPAAYQRLMDIVLTGLQRIECFVYLHYVVIYASSIADHAQKVENVLKRLRQHNPRLQPDKCEFMRHIWVI